MCYSVIMIFYSFGATFLSFHLNKLVKYFSTKWLTSNGFFFSLIIHTKSQDLQRKSLLEELLPRGLVEFGVQTMKMQPRSSNLARSPAHLPVGFPVFPLFFFLYAWLLFDQLQNATAQLCFVLQLHHHHVHVQHPLYAAGWVCVCSVGAFEPSLRTNSNPLSLFLFLRIRCTLKFVGIKRQCFVFETMTTDIRITFLKNRLDN